MGTVPANAVHSRCTAEMVNYKITLNRFPCIKPFCFRLKRASITHMRAMKTKIVKKDSGSSTPPQDEPDSSDYEG